MVGTTIQYCIRTMNLKSFFMAMTYIYRIYLGYDLDSYTTYVVYVNLYTWVAGPTV